MLAAAIGITLLVGVRRQETRTAAALGTLAVSSALAFAAIDFWYGLRGVISPIYLADGVLELGWIALLIPDVMKRTPRPGRAG